MNDFIEMRIIDAVKNLLSGRVNELLNDLDFIFPVVEFSEYKGAEAVVPVVKLSGCETSEKERLVRLDAYTLTVTFNVPETIDSELNCYAYAYAVCKAIETNPTLGGVADRAIVSGKKYVPPIKANCGMDWELVITLRITVEGVNYAG